MSEAGKMGFQSAMAGKAFLRRQRLSKDPKEVSDRGGHAPDVGRTTSTEGTANAMAQRPRHA